MSYFSFQGQVSIAERVGGVAGAFRYVGNVPGIAVNLEEDKIEHFESNSGSRLSDFQLTKSVKGAFSMTLEDMNKENLMLALRGASNTVTAGTFTDTALATGLTVGSRVQLAQFNVSGITIEDSSGSPKTLPATQYNVLPSGVIEFLDVTTGGPYTQPFLVSGSFGASTQVAMANDAQREWEIRFDGVDTANGNAPVLLRLYRVRMSVAKNLELIHTELGKFDLEGTVLVDTTKSHTGVLGQFGLIQTV